MPTDIQPHSPAAAQEPAPPGQTEAPTAAPAQAPLWSVGMRRGQRPGTKEMCLHQGKSLQVLILEGGRCLVQIRGDVLSFFWSYVKGNFAMLLGIAC